MTHAPPLRHAAHAALAALVALATVLALLPPARAGAQDPPAPDPGAEAVAEAPPAGPAVPAPGGTTLTLAQLGLGATVTLAGATASRVLPLPVPDGLGLDRLTGTLRTSAATAGGRLDVLVDDVVVATYDLAGAGTPAGLALDVPLTSGRPRDRVVPVELVARLGDHHRDVCSAMLDVPSVDLAGGAVTYTGTPTPPRTISDFLPAVLTEVDLVIPAAPTPQQVQAVLRLAADLTLLAGAQRPAIEVRTADQPAPPAAGPLRRTFEVGDGPTGIALGGDPANPTLKLTGDEAALPQQVELLTGQLARLPVAPTAAVAQAPPVDQQLGRGRRTLASLGLGNLQGQALGRLDLAIPFSQADLGGPSRSMVAFLEGTTTPVPDGGFASTSVLLNDIVVQTQALDPVGTFDLRVPLPNDLVGRDNRLVVRVDYVPAGGLCGTGAQPLTVQIAPASRLEVADGTTLPPGFDRFPQALLPTFAVALSALDLPSAQVATDLVITLQQASSRLLRPEVRPWSAAISTNQPTVFVGPESTDLDAALHPPVALTQGRPVQVTADRTQLQIGGDVAALEAFNVGERDIILATWQGDPALLTTLVGTVVADPGGWRALTGDVVVQGVDGPPAPLSVRTPLDGVSADVAAEPSSSSAITVVALAVVVGLVVLAATWLLWRRRSRRATGAAGPGTPPAPPATGPGPHAGEAG